jgi:hypothetical protein
VILSKIKARICKTTHKYGIEVPMSIEHAYSLDRENNNSLWRDALAMEMTEIGVAFGVLAEGQNAPPKWKMVTGHMVWDLKMDCTRKARWVLRDIKNAYLQPPSSQKDYIICGPEFGLENVGMVALIHRALYGGKSAGGDFRNHLRSCMRFLDFTPYPADPDIWMQPAIKSDGAEYYEYILLYTDDALCVGENAENVLRNELGRYFPLKVKSVSSPMIYLGGHVRKVQLENGVECMAFGSLQYVKAAVHNRI